MPSPRVICPSCETSYTTERCGIVLADHPVDATVVCGLCQEAFNVRVEYVAGTPARVEPGEEAVLLRAAVPARTLPQTWLASLVQTPIVIAEIPAVYSPGSPERIIPEVAPRHTITTSSKAR